MKKFQNIVLWIFGLNAIFVIGYAYIAPYFMSPVNKWFFLPPFILMFIAWIVNDIILYKKYGCSNLHYWLIMRDENKEKNI